MPPVNYKVSQPGVVSDAVRALLRRAEAEGRLALVVQAAKYMRDELAYDPTHFGEARTPFVTLELDYRVAFVRPLMVEFTIHEPSRRVFIRRVVLTD